MKPHEIIEKVFKDEFGEDWGNELRDFEHGFSDFYNCSIKAVEEALHIADVSGCFSEKDMEQAFHDGMKFEANGLESFDIDNYR